MEKSLKEMIYAYVQEKPFSVVGENTTKNPYDHAQAEMEDRISYPRILKATVTAVLLVNMTVSCLLRAALQNNYYGQKKCYVKPHEPE